MFIGPDPTHVVNSYLGSCQLQVSLSCTFIYKVHIRTENTIKPLCIRRQVWKSVFFPSVYFKWKLLNFHYNKTSNSSFVSITRMWQSIRGKYKFMKNNIRARNSTEIDINERVCLHVFSINSTRNDTVWKWIFRKYFYLKKKKNSFPKIEN